MTPPPSFLSLALFASSLLPSVTAHYYFPHLIVNNTITEEFKYVRDVAPPPNSTYDDTAGYNGKEAPVYGEFDTKYMTDVRCGRDAFAVGAAKTETATVLAGTSVGFHIKVYQDPSYNNGVFHPGPAQAYMQKSDDLKTDEGDGEWFKIWYLGPDSETHWATDRATQFNFSIPETTPPGDYLLRLELPFPIKDWPGHSQWYVNCAHINLISSGGGTPGPTIKIPEAYTITDPGINFEDGVDFDSGLGGYHPPGPPVWVG